MHRVDTKRQKKALLRVIAYTITLVLTVLTTVVLLYIALGYRLDRESGHVVRSGLLLVDTKPEAAQILINNEQKDGEAPGRFVLSAGQYDLSLRLNGYRDWNKRVQLAASGVREVNYPLLIPTDLKPQTVAESESPSMVSQSLDRKYLLSHITNQSTLTLTELSAQSPKQTVLPLSSAVIRENNNQIGSLKVIEWALNNKQVLIQQTLPSGAVQLLSIDVTRPSEMINISTLFGAEAPADVHYAGGETEQIYGVKNGILSQYSLASKASEVLLQNIRSYQPYSDDTILFDRVNGQMAEIGIWRDKVATVVESAPSTSAPAHLKYASYDGNNYFVVAHPDAKLIIYKDPTKKPILAKQLPLVAIEFSGTTKVTFSSSSRFILAQNGSKLVTYDLEDLVQHKITLPFKTLDNNASWFDAFHMQARAESGETFIMDFDGKNRQPMVPVLAMTELYFAPNYRFMYSFTASQPGTALQTTSLVAE